MPDHIDLIAKVVGCARRAECVSPYYRERAEEELVDAIAKLDLSIQCLKERARESESHLGCGMPVLLWDEDKGAHYIKFVTVSK